MTPAQIACLVVSCLAFIGVDTKNDIGVNALLFVMAIILQVVAHV